MITRLPAAPGPGSTFTVPGGPTEQQATDTAVNYGWMIALLILTAVVLALGRFLWGSMAVRILLAAVGGGWLVYLVTKG
jgi:hypothetical protein